MNNQQIKERVYSLGETAAKLHDIELALYKTTEDEAAFEKNLSALVRLVGTRADAQAVIVRLSRDSRTDVREIAASLIDYLWRYWKSMPYHEDKKSAYEKTAQNYARSLSWTIPLIKDFILGRATQPLLISLYTIWEMEYAKPTEIASLRDAVLSIAKHNSVEVRKALIRTLANYYPDNGEALHILDEQAFQFYIDATYDSNEQVRDWALFELHTSIEDHSRKAAHAFAAAFERESPESEAYVEAVVGMAKLGLQYDKLTAVIMDSLSQEHCGTGWFDAADYVHSEEMRTALSGLRDKISQTNREDERLPLLNDILNNWNHELY
jgi:hypothetical protein